MTMYLQVDELDTSDTAARTITTKTITEWILKQFPSIIKASQNTCTTLSQSPLNPLALPHCACSLPIPTRNHWQHWRMPLGTNFSETSLPQHPRPNKAPARMLESAYLRLIAVYMERDGSIAVTNASNISVFCIWAQYARGHSLEKKNWKQNLQIIS